jgi:hypothetical protein
MQIILLDTLPHSRYNDAKFIIEASELPVDESIIFHVLPPENHEEERIFDRQIEREFIYNCGDGSRAWIEEFVDPDGDVLREWSHRVSHLM